MSGDPYPDMEPFPFEDLFWHGWKDGDLTPEGGTFFVACKSCRVYKDFRGVPPGVPDVFHESSCPVLAYIASPEGGTEGRARIHRILRADDRPPSGSVS